MSQPALECDLVMKGGITSGVVYPEALHELAKTYRFRNLGGTSAGAIAAAAAAAASYGRARGRADAFERCQQIPTWLGEVPAGSHFSRLIHLFSAQPSTSRYLNLALVFVGPKQGRATRCLKLALTQFPLPLFLALIVSVLIKLPLALHVQSAPLLSWALLLIDFFVLSSLLWFLFLAVTLLRGFPKAVGNNDYGLSRGFASKDPLSPDLSSWLHDLIQDLSGLKRPLTFGDLWGAGEEPETNLVMMATNVTQGRPICLPYVNDPATTYYFDASEISKFFPESIVDHMVEHSGAQSVDLKLNRTLWAWPEPAHLPVLVATRMSLSFPVLLSAVPLYAIDYSRPPEHQKLERNWISDGGITSNFPIHFFDAALPRRPTFGINLTPTHPDRPRERIWMPQTNGQGRAARWFRFDSDDQADLVGFVSAILTTMQNWSDQEQMRVPGYRDRIVHVNLAADEGGLNLNMDKQKINDLSLRGREAAQELAKRFDPQQADEHVLNWANHRWVRYRALMNSLEQLLKQMKRAFDTVPLPSAGVSYLDLIERPEGSDPKSYPFANQRQRRFAISRTQRLMKEIAGWQHNYMTFGPIGKNGGPPKPTPKLRMMPSLTPSSNKHTTAAEISQA